MKIYKINLIPTEEEIAIGTLTTLGKVKYYTRKTDMFALVFEGEWYAKEQLQPVRVEIKELPEMDKPANKLFSSLANLKTYSCSPKLSEYLVYNVNHQVTEIKENEFEFQQLIIGEMKTTIATTISIDSIEESEDDRVASLEAINAEYLKVDDYLISKINRDNLPEQLSGKTISENTISLIEIYRKQANQMQTQIKK
jgi:hypothetical protein